MASTLGTILYVTLLLVNAIAVLNEERFLARVGWTSSQAHTHSFESAGFGSNGAGPGGDVSVKARLVNLISAVRTLLRVPLIILNVVVIIYEVLLG